jgi:hypothetical protein
MYVYSLSDPRTSEVKYIGQTSRVDLNRPRQHAKSSSLSRERNLHKKFWIMELKKQGLMYDIDILERTSGKEALNEAEVFWISYFRFIGAKLTNLSEGGIGERPLNGRSLELRNKVSRSLGGTAIQDELGNIYQSKNEAARKLNIARQSITKVLSGKYRHVDGHTFSKAGGKQPKPYVAKGSRGPLPAQTKNKISNAQSRPIKDNFGNKYVGVTAASTILGIGRKGIQKVLCGKSKSYKGYSFAWERDDIRKDWNIRKKKAKKPKVEKPPLRHKVFDLRSGKIYGSVTEAVQVTGIPRSTFVRNLNLKKPSRRVFHFKYLDNNLTQEG